MRQRHVLRGGREIPVTEVERHAREVVRRYRAVGNGTLTEICRAHRGPLRRVAQQPGLALLRADAVCTGAESTAGAGREQRHREEHEKTWTD